MLDKPLSNVSGQVRTATELNAETCPGGLAGHEPPVGAHVIQ